MTSDELRKKVINDLLLCDECGRLHLDDTAALSESCDCGRFKQRMEWATVNDVLETIDRLTARVAELELALESRQMVRDAYREAKEQGERMDAAAHKRLEESR